ncbi:MAG: hypothetical protein HMLKMBBP_01948 [Planctomycetes bacterium]|nr:hypothetical protein [Planctomycetota bacterium]
MRKRPKPPESYALLPEREKRHYLAYYRMVFADGELTLETKELIAFACSLLTGAPNCAAGHLRKLRKMGVSDAKIREAVAAALGAGGAAIVDRADIAADAVSRSAPKRTRR